MTAPVQTRLRDVATFIRGLTFKPADVGPIDQHRSVACMRTKNVQEALELSDVWGISPAVVKRSDQYLRQGDVLVSSANSWNLIGRCCWVPVLEWPATFGGFVSVLRANPGRIDPRYLFRWFSSPRTQAIVRSFGNQTTNISNLDISRCLELELVLPSLHEQRRIAHILDKGDALCGKRAATKSMRQELQRSVFLEMFGDPIRNDRQWPVIPFGEVCVSKLGKMLDAKRQKGVGRRPYLRNANVQWFRFELDDLNEMDFDETERASLRLVKGDLLICEGGEPGRAAVWNGEVEECYFQKALHRARPRPTMANSHYLSWLLWFLADRQQLAGVTSATIAHLTAEKLAALPTVLPPLALQNQFAERLASIGALAASQNRSAELLAQLFTSLQHRAFSGERTA